MDVPYWCRRTGQSDQMGFCLAIDPSWSMSTGGTALQSGGQAVLDKLLAYSPDCRWAHVQRLADLLIGPA
jgi:hypothetical protein